MPALAMARCLLVLLLGLLLGPPAWGEVAVPPLQSRVTDLTGTLSAAQQQSLEQRLAAFERAKGSQIAVLLVPTVRPESIAQYSMRVAEAWKLGRKGVDDGLLLLVARDDREVRIEVGYGLEGAVPDAVAKRIIEETILPRFRAGDLAGGIEAGVGRLMAVVGGEALPSPAADSAGGSVDTLFPVFMAAVIAGSLLRTLLGRLLAAALCGAGAALVAALMGAPFLGMGGIALLVFLFVLMGGRGMGGGGGWRSGGGGGFSAGGGSFGGGGASGRW